MIYSKKASRIIFLTSGLLFISPMPHILYELNKLIFFVGLTLLSLFSILAMRKNEGRIVSSSFISLFFPLFLLGALGLIHNDFDRFIKDALIFISPLFLLFLIFSLFPRGARGVKELSNNILLLSAIIVLAQSIFFLLGYSSFTNRYEFRHDYVLGATIILLIAPLSFLFAKGRDFTIGFMVVVLLSCATLSLTLSRDFLLFSVLLIFFITVYKTSRAASIWLVRLVPIYPFIYTLYVLYFSDFDSMDPSVGWRVIEIKSYLNYINEDFSGFFIGAGFGSYLRTISPIPLNGELISEIPKFHSLWLYILFKFGVFGLIFSFYFLTKIIRNIEVRGLRDYVLVYASYYFIFVNGSTTGSFTQSFPSVFIFAVLMFFISCSVDVRKVFHEGSFYNKANSL